VDPGPECDATKPCPSGKKCWKGKCIREDYCESVSDCKNGQKCVRNKCESPNPGCKQDGDCTSGEKCVQSKCVPGSVKKQLGETCTNTPECVSGAICVADTDKKMYCLKVCDPLEINPGCPATHGCGLLSNNRHGACFKKKGGAAGKEGDSCNQSAPHCEVHLQCVQDGAASYCMRLCNTTKNNCANGNKCVSVGTAPLGVCSLGGGAGTSCTKTSQCRKGFLCVGTGSNGQCTQQCDPVKGGCPTANVCSLIVNYSTKNVLAAVCTGPLNGNGEGKLCSYQTASSNCQSHLFCFPNLQRVPTGLCARACDPITKKPCRSNQQCVISPISYNGQKIYGCI